jgi:hypothetical protein
MSPQELDNAILSARESISALDNCSKRLDHWLLFFTALVVVGIALEIIEAVAEHIHEYHAWRWTITWLPEKPNNALFGLRYFAIILLVAGVGGELGVNVLSMRVNNKLRIRNEELVELVDRKAGIATLKAGDAEKSSERATKEAEKSENLAHAVRREADLVKKDVISAEERVKNINAFLTPRSLSQNEMDQLRDMLKPIADPTVPIVIHSSWESGLGVQVLDSLNRAGFSEARLKEEFIPQFGMGISAPRKYISLADKIGTILLKERIGPMMGAVGSAPDNDPIHIFLGDLRSAPLPNLK